MAFLLVFPFPCLCQQVELYLNGFKFNLMAIYCLSGLDLISRHMLILIITYYTPLIERDVSFVICVLHIVYGRSCKCPCCGKLTLQTQTYKSVYDIFVQTETPLMKFERDVSFVANYSWRTFIKLKWHTVPYHCCGKLTPQTQTCKLIPKPKVYIISLQTETPLMKFERDVSFRCK